MEPRDIAKKIFISLYPDYKDWFDTYWDAVSDIQKIGDGTSNVKISDALGISSDDVSEIIVEQFNLIIALFDTLGKMGSEIEIDAFKERFRETIKNYPLKNKTKEKIKQNIENLPEFETKLPVTKPKKYRVFLNYQGKKEKGKIFTDKELMIEERKIKEYRIWIDRRTETILLDGEPLISKNQKLGYHEYNFLICLLKHDDDKCFYKNIFQEVWGIEQTEQQIYSLLHNRLKKRYQF